MNRVPGIGFMDTNMNGNAIFLMRGFPKIHYGRTNN
jgi:hypothetical protein